MGDYLHSTLINCRAKYDAAGFILGGEISDRTNTQTVTNISTPCLSVCVDNKIIKKPSCLEETVPVKAREDSLDG